MKSNLTEELLLRARKNKDKTKTEDIIKGLFILTPGKSLFNGVENI